MPAVLILRLAPGRSTPLPRQARSGARERTPLSGWNGLRSERRRRHPLVTGRARCARHSGGAWSQPALCAAAASSTVHSAKHAAQHAVFRRRAVSWSCGFVRALGHKQQMSRARTQRPPWRARTHTRAREMGRADSEWRTDGRESAVGPGTESGRAGPACSSESGSGSGWRAGVGECYTRGVQVGSV